MCWRRVARCRARGELEWLWDVEIGPPGGAPTAIATVAIAVRPIRAKKLFEDLEAGSGACVPQAAWSFTAARETPMQARRAVVDWAQKHVDDRAVLSDIALAVTEATTNVVLHAYRDREVPGTVIDQGRAPTAITCASTSATRAPGSPRAWTARGWVSASG